MRPLSTDLQPEVVYQRPTSGRPAQVKTDQRYRTNVCWAIHHSCGLVQVELPRDRGESGRLGLYKASLPAEGRAARQAVIATDQAGRRVCGHERRAPGRCSRRPGNRAPTSGNQPRHRLSTSANVRCTRCLRQPGGLSPAPRGLGPRPGPLRTRSATKPQASYR